LRATSQLDDTDGRRSNRRRVEPFMNASSICRRLLAVAAGFLLAAPLLGAGPTNAARPTTLAYEASAVVGSVKTFQLPRPASDVAVHWLGQRGAHVRVAFSPDASDSVTRALSGSTSWARP
jgi:hypothetical protein